MYKIELSRSARKAYMKVPGKIRILFGDKLNQLAKSPFAPHSNVKPLQGMKNCYRLRVGDWRLVYRIHQGVLIIEVIKVAHRKEVYQ